MQFTTHDLDQLQARDAVKLPLLRAIARRGGRLANRLGAVASLVALGESLPGPAVDLLGALVSDTGANGADVMLTIDAALRRDCISDGPPRNRLLRSLASVACNPRYGWYQRRVAASVLADLGIDPATCGDAERQGEGD